MPDSHRGPGAPGRVLSITSLANPIVKEIRGLALPKNRRSSGLFVAEGLKLVADAMEAGWTIRDFVHASRAGEEPHVARLAAQVHARGGSVISVSEAVLAKITRRENPQTVIGVFQQKLLTPAQIRPEAAPVWVVLENIRDPGNLGTIIRTSDAVGAGGVILVGETVDPFSIEAVRATMGSVFHVPIARLTRIEFETLRRRWPGMVAGTHLAGAVDYRSVTWREPVLLVMGNEQAGLSPEMAGLCDVLVKIPMAGKADSLNLAIATGVMLFEVLRGRLKLDG
jgi:TrmH family RNA methyltransferase